MLLGFTLLLQSPGKKMQEGCRLAVWGLENAAFLWMEGQNGDKKYPDSCGRGLSLGKMSATKCSQAKC